MGKYQITKVAVAADALTAGPAGLAEPGMSPAASASRSAMMGYYLLPILCPCELPVLAHQAQRTGDSPFFSGEQN